MDGAFESHGVRLGITLKSPASILLTNAIEIYFQVIKNQVEYEALIVVLQFIFRVGAVVN